MIRVVVTGSFDDLQSRQVRFLEEASKLGAVCVRLWPDAAVHALEGRAPKFPEEERRYLLEAVRYVSRVELATNPVARDAVPYKDAGRPDVWVVDVAEDNARKRASAQAHGVAYRVLTGEDLEGFPVAPPAVATDKPPRKKVVVTGCFDWFHSGHVRFFEEVAELGDLYVVVGHDANLRLLKGEGHPLFPQEERRYMVQAVRHVTQALISTGDGWMDAEPEIVQIKPDIYAVNEDGDKPEKRAFCAQHGLEYVVLKRTPREGLPRRSSTNLRGF